MIDSQEHNILVNKLENVEGILVKWVDTDDCSIRIANSVIRNPDAVKKLSDQLANLTNQGSNTPKTIKALESINETMKNFASQLAPNQDQDKEEDEKRTFRP